MANLPSKTKDYAAWYNAVVKAAGLAENSATKGAMVMKPYGFALWESIQGYLNEVFKAKGHQNAYFPLLIPVSYFSREASHIEGFAKECAVVTHYRLKPAPNGQGIVVDPAAALEEPLVVRPTSETIIWECFRKWIQSHRDLPLKVNQWANVVRWEMRTRPFLRTSEFLWQEGHTAHATAAEAKAQAKEMAEVYQTLMHDLLAIPVITGCKTAHERFAGAGITHTLEGLMPDGKALQMGTSHFLGQTFAKTFGVRYADPKGTLSYVWGTSWGVTTRLLGALVMTHGDEKGLVLPPKIAPIQAVVLPIYKKGTPTASLLEAAEATTQLLTQAGIRTKLDASDAHQAGWKFHEYELKGVPIRLAIGPKDLAQQQVEITRRDTNQKVVVPKEQVLAYVQEALVAMQASLYEKALAFQKAHTLEVNDWDTFQEAIANKKGFVLAHWDGTTATELAIKAATQATIRCLPDHQPLEAGKCIYSGKPSKQRVIFAPAY